MSKHTPGPWSVGGEPSLKVWGPRHTQIVICEAWHVADGDQRANAHLIAAAPEMLEALKAVECGAPFEVVVDQVRAAIAKAEGR